ncbi:MAG: M24 family metallopeptidase [Clostridiales Family XIII bacterium]|jgi:Xaa-Pro aminopeptidase|nr:M24 family metallopeptidase [Clostridiales Family XIII bacterium]
MKQYAHGVAHSEMKRRQNAALAAMEKRGLDCLILYANPGKLGGAMMYLTDVFPAGSYPHCAVFGKDGVFLIGHGVKGGATAPAQLDPPNITENIGLPVTPSMCYADSLYPAEMVRIIKNYDYRRVGLVGMSYISAAVYKYLTETLADREFEDATDMIDRIRAVKSQHELDLWAKCVRMHERIFAALPAVIRPGRSEYSVVQETEYLAKSLGCPICGVMLGSDDKRPHKSPALYRDKIIGPGDYINFLLELATPGALWGELGRVFSLAKPNPAMRRAEKDSIELQAFIAERSKPGVMPGELLALLNENLIERGYAPETRIFAHGQGYDIVERPVYSEWETMPLKENMLVAIHPTCGNKDSLCSNTDNYVIKPEGALRLSSVPSGIIVIE